MEKLMFVLELIGAAAFAVSGAMAAIKNRADIFGVIFLAVTTALGGGVIRDVLLGNLPPKMFVSYAYFSVSVIAAVVVFADAYIRREKYLLHRDRLGRISLALDLMEEMRAVMADRFVLTLINTKVIRREHFTRQESGAVLLTDPGRKAVLSAWQSRKREELTHPYLREKMYWGLVPYVQALLLSRTLRGDLDAYPPLLWK